MPTQLPLEVEEWIYTHRTPTSALLASSVATLIGFPLDSVKSRLQVSKYHGFMDCVRKTYKHEGVQGFFRGLTMPLLTITLVRTVSFSIYDATKKKLAKPGSSVFDPSTFTGRAALGFAGGATSGLLLSAGTCAFELVKVRSQLEYLISKRRGVPYQPKGTFSGASLVSITVPNGRPCDTSRSPASDLAAIRSGGRTDCVGCTSATLSIPSVTRSGQASTSCFTTPPGICWQTHATVRTYQPRWLRSSAAVLAVSCRGSWSIR